MRTFLSGFCCAVAPAAKSAASVNKKARNMVMAIPPEVLRLAYCVPVNSAKPSAKDLIRRMPKAELHMHLEGSLEPDLMFRLARRHGITLPYASEEALQAAYDFTDLQSFLN